MKKAFNLIILVIALVAAVAFSLAEKLTKSKNGQVAASQYKQKRATIRCKPPEDGLLTAGDIPPLTGWGNYKWKITTSSDSTQFYFNQGINMYYAFHTLESRASFNKAIRFDSSCAMAWYGKALAYGPTINDGNGFRATAEAERAGEKSRSYVSSCNSIEKALIWAIGKRYSLDTSADLKTLQLRYSHAMKQVTGLFPGNADVWTLYADALMLEHPWDLYDKNLAPKPWTSGITKALVQALALAPLHPGANHYMVHTMEGSLHPEKATPNAEILVTLMPDVAHISHMPSHIYIRTGNYKKGMEVNVNAINAYNKYLILYEPVKEVAALYQIHAIHMNFTCAMMAGNYTHSQQESENLRSVLPVEELDNSGAFGNYLQYAYMSRLFNEIRFGKWDDVLKEPEMDSLVYASLLMHFGRGVAFARLNQIPKAEQELGLLQKRMQLNMLKEPLNPFSSAFDAALVAENILSGVIAEQKNQNTVAIASFQKAVVAEDNLIYNEPRDWLLPAREYLGDMYLRMGLFPQAIVIFKEDLKINPTNGWSLTGLKIAYQATGDQKALKQTDADLSVGWQIRDLPINRPVF
jgi:tetratricopeptide (TPR) repeat protein